MGYAPQPRILKPGPPLEQGDDVAVYQETLHALKFLEQPYRAAEYAENTWEAVEAFGKAHGIEPSNTLGPRVHALLSPHFTAGQGFRLAEELGKLQGGKGQLVAQAALWYHQAGPYGYTQARPFPLEKAPAVAGSLDCSGFAITCYYSVGHIAALGAENQGGYGNTFTLVKYGTPVDLPHVQAGDLVFQNTDQTNGHVVVAISPTMSVSHGHTGFPEIVPITRYPIYGIRRYL